ncbi:MAG TPA: hypothetical protein VMQ17_17720 [Candidatus Sulfotelmatobacter sp.]|jgi:hypothetical protein|nr:hypothetical protein [Candidatus Sulfotelmatobacter sp.]
MKSKCFALAILLIVPPVATPETTISSCDVRMLIHPGRVLDGVKIEHDTVEFMIPCLDKRDLAKVLSELMADQESHVKDKAARILQDAGEVNVMLTTKLSARTAGE